MPTRRIVIDHLSIGVSDLERSRAFYRAALAPLGMSELYENDRGIAFGPPELDDFTISLAYAAGGTSHIAFAADSTAEVDAFHAAALAAGGTDNGAPGPRADYSPGYYGAFVLDPDANNVEAVFHDPDAAGD
jgi:catechol 2,3-dioxygenase-like lactoylglutathione lyase family enzyme